MTTSRLIKFAILALSGLAAFGVWAEAGTSKEPERESTANGGALAGHRYRVIVSTDVGGTDPDDFQSLVHVLVYADCFDIEGLVSSPYGPGRKKHILEVIDCYEKDYANLKTYSSKYPPPDALRALTKQGETDVAPYAGVRRATEGSNWIVACARRDDPRPLYVLVWGGIEDLAQILHDAPDILPKLRVYWIGGPNKKWGPNAYQYIVNHHPELWIIEANATYRGWFVGGDQKGQWGNTEFVKRHIAGKSALGEFFKTQLGGTIKMGDTPSVGWLLNGTPDDPSQPGWGGRFVRARQRPHTLSHRLTTTDDRMETFGVDDGRTQGLYRTGIEPNKDYYVRLRLQPSQVFAEVSHDGQVWWPLSTFSRGKYAGDPIEIRLGKMAPGGKNVDADATPNQEGSCTIGELRVYGSE